LSFGRAVNELKLGAKIHLLRNRKAAFSFPICLFLSLRLRLVDQIDHVNNYIGSLQLSSEMTFDGLLLNGGGDHANENGA
jgi:hypothetical protein